MGVTDDVVFWYESTGLLYIEMHYLQNRRVWISSLGGGNSTSATSVLVLRLIKYKIGLHIYYSEPLLSFQISILLNYNRPSCQEQNVYTKPQ